MVDFSSQIRGRIESIPIHFSIWDFVALISNHNTWGWALSIGWVKKKDVDWLGIQEPHSTDLLSDGLRETVLPGNGFTKNSIVLNLVWDLFGQVEVRKA